MTTLLTTSTGSLLVPDLVLIDRRDGGHLIVNPPREVWERSELTNEELIGWSLLIAAAGQAMLETLPQLSGGCINYWEAGNWSLHPDAEPRGVKTPRQHRRVHMHLLGRSPNAVDPSWAWGEAPRFPRFSDRIAWAAGHQRLNANECSSIAAHVAASSRLRGL